MDATEWTPWRILTAASVGLFVVVYPFFYRQLVREHGRKPGFAGQMIAQGGMSLYVLSSLFERRTPMADGLVLLGSLALLAGFVVSLVARRRASRGPEPLESA